MRLKAVPSILPPVTDISTSRRWLQRLMSDFTLSGTTDGEVIEAIKLMLPEYEQLGKLLSNNYQGILAGIGEGLL